MTDCRVGAYPVRGADGGETEVWAA